MTNKVLQNYEGGRFKLPLYNGKVVPLELTELLGSGAFGHVWKARDLDEFRFYALKIIQAPQFEGLIQRFRLEAEVLIPSKYTISPQGFQEWDSQTCLILFDYFPGQTLSNYLESVELTTDKKKKIFRQILQGVADAHRCNIIHRDIKPANILVAEERVKIIDFGIAKFKEHKLTKPKQIMGTYPWMAPEVLIRGGAIADARVDIYALGHIFYQIETGQHFWGRQGWGLNGFEQWVQKYLSKNPTEGIDLQDFTSEIHPHGKEIISRMVKINPEERFSNVEEVLAELGSEPIEKTLEQPIEIEKDREDNELRTPVLIIESGSNKNAKTTINIPDGGNLILGRGELAGNDSSISRKHIEFIRRKSQYLVRDVGSKNGTLFKGSLLKSKGSFIPINHRDSIKVGDIFLRFIWSKNV
ncbi:MAG: FHA domain-containing serine/threonine-protein kinase [Prochloraceae cyanobacterium]|nr:FHA domain-containing serine/threonine-protein kinase [Prochloraceae cyanobacterium]